MQMGQLIRTTLDRADFRLMGATTRARRAVARPWRVVRRQGRPVPGVRGRLGRRRHGLRPDRWDRGNGIAGPSRRREKNYFLNLADAVAGYPDVFFIVVSGEISANDYKRLIQSGNAEWVAETGLKQEVLDVLGRVGSAAAADDERRPVVVSFIPSAGGVGNSTLAIETAVQQLD